MRSRTSVRIFVATGVYLSIYSPIENPVLNLVRALVMVLVGWAIYPKKDDEFD